MNGKKVLSLALAATMSLGLLAGCGGGNDTTGGGTEDRADDKRYEDGDKADREDINDDIVFELELVKQVEVNIDYILMLVAKYHAANCKDKEILVSIEKAVNASMELRSKRELIEGFIERVNFFDSVDEGWREYVRESREKEMEALIAEEKLKPEPARRFIEQALKDGELRTTGTDIDKIMPPVPLFGGGGRGARAKLRETLIEKLKKFFEKYFGAA